MKRALRGIPARYAIGLSAMALVAVALLSCNRKDAGQNQTASAQPASSVDVKLPPQAAAAPPAAAPRAIPPNTEFSVVTVDSVMLSHPPDAPTATLVDVSGTVPSGGWSGAKLVADDSAPAAPGIKTFKFVAVSPQDGATAATPQSIATELRVDALPPDVTTIRIVAGTNEVSAPVTQ